MKAIPESVSSGDDGDDGSSDEGGEQLHPLQAVARRQSRGPRRVSKHGPRALSRREILGAEDPDNEGLQWLKKRGELSSKVQAKLDALVPVEKSLDRLWKKVGDEYDCDLPKPKKELMDEIAGAVTQYKGMIKTLKTAKLAEWGADHETQYDTMMAGAELVKRTATQSLATLTAWWEEGRKTVRSQDNKVIYQIRKVKEFLIEGGWEDKAAHHVAPFVAPTVLQKNDGAAAGAEGLGEALGAADHPSNPEHVLVNAKEFDPERANVTVLDDSVAMKFLQKYQSSIGGWPMEAVRKSNEYLKKQTRKVGVHAKTPLPTTDFEADLGEDFYDPELQKENGAFASIVALRANRCRIGPGAFPLAGIGAFCQAPSHDVSYLLISMAALLENGIALMDAGKYLTTADAARMMKEEPEKAYVVKVKAGGVAWIPYGYLCVPIFLGLAAANKNDVHHLFAIPVFNKPSAAKLSREVKQAMYNYNLTHFKNQGSTSVEFGARTEVFQDFCKSIDVNIVPPERE